MSVNTFPSSLLTLFSTKDSVLLHQESNRIQDYMGVEALLILTLYRWSASAPGKNRWLTQIMHFKMKALIKILVEMRQRICLGVKICFMGAEASHRCIYILLTFHWHAKRLFGTISWPVSLFIYNVSADAVSHRQYLHRVKLYHLHCDSFWAAALWCGLAHAECSAEW